MHDPHNTIACAAVKTSNESLQLYNKLTVFCYPSLKLKIINQEKEKTKPLASRGRNHEQNPEELGLSREFRLKSDTRKKKKDAGMTTRNTWATATVDKNDITAL